MDYTTIPSNAVISQTIDSLTSHGISAELVDSKRDALNKIISLIPQGSSVMNGSSTTLIDLGFVEYLKSGTHGWKNLHEEVLRETDWVKQSELRRLALAQADYFLMSVNALTQDGKLVAVDNTGSRVGALPYVAKKIIIVASANKITQNLDEAYRRIHEHVFPLENERMKHAYNMPSGYGKWVIVEKEIVPGRIHVVLVKEKLGF